MSANNYLSIIHVVKNRWEVWMMDAESGCFMGKPKKAKTLQGAIKKALKYLQEEDVEYGIQSIEL
jgi:hypothetical protein